MLKPFDYIIVGAGLAGLTLSLRLFFKNRTFLIFDHYHNLSTDVAGGVLNPYNLKNFRLLANGLDYFECASRFYSNTSDFFYKKNIYKTIPIHKILSSEEEGNRFLSSKINNKHATVINNIFLQKNHFQKGFCVKNTGFLDTKLFRKTIIDFFKTKGFLSTSKFEYEKIKRGGSTGFFYNNFKAKHIVFCEGNNIENNPFFNNLPLLKSYGGYLNIPSNNIIDRHIVKKKHFVIPNKIRGLYRIGATYKSTDDYLTRDTQKKDVEKEASFFSLPKNSYMEYGVRSVSLDRMPILGEHPEYKNLFVFNGLGSRGILTAPKLSENLLDSIEKNGFFIPQELSVRRYFNYFNS